MLQTLSPLQVTAISIDAYLEHEKMNNAPKDSLRQRKTHITAFYEWLPDPKELTIEILLAWRQDMEARGYSQATILNYVKSINRYLDFQGRSDLRFNRGKAKNIKDREFGFLTALENTGKKNRNDYVWKCRCRCGKIVELPATRLLAGNTQSCGCLHTEIFRRVNRYIDNTSLRSALEERVYSAQSASGYTGVSPKRDKWQAYITYKGKRYSLGCYAKLEDAVKARADAKALVQADAKRLEAIYEQSLCNN